MRWSASFDSEVPHAEKHVRLLVIFKAMVLLSVLFALCRLLNMHVAAVGVCLSFLVVAWIAQAIWPARPRMASTVSGAALGTLYALIGSASISATTHYVDSILYLVALPTGAVGGYILGYVAGVLIALLFTPWRLESAEVVNAPPG